MKFVALVLAALSLSACGSPEKPTTGSGSCADLVGHKVSPTASCEAFVSPGSFGCYDETTMRQTGSWYYFGTERPVYGREGGTWLEGAPDATITDMSHAIGC